MQIPTRPFVDVDGNYVPLQNKPNDYLIDREAQKTVSYHRHPGVRVQDMAVQEDQRGRISDRTHGAPGRQRHGRHRHPAQAHQAGASAGEGAAAAAGHDLARPRYRVPHHGGSRRAGACRGRSSCGSYATSPVRRSELASAPQSCLLAIRAPSALAASLAQAISGWPDALAEAAIGAGDDVLFADQRGVLHQPLGDQLGVLDQVRRVADDARHERLAVRQLDVLPDRPIVLVARVRRLDRDAFAP